MSFFVQIARVWIAYQNWASENVVKVFVEVDGEREADVPVEVGADASPVCQGSNKVHEDG
jgi:hypothetical protein